MLDNIKIGSQIARLRREKGLTGEKFAEALGVSPQAVSKWENGKCLPESALLPELSRLLGISADQLLDPPEGCRPAGPDDGLRILAAWFGSKQNQRDVMHKMRHYDYFRWDEIRVNHETFPSDPRSDAPEALTLVYLNETGVHTVTCPEGQALRYSDDKTDLFPADRDRCVLPGIPPLQWDRGEDCCWAGANVRTLNAMGEPYTYEQVMGLSGACYRLNFCDVWDWSATDALVAFDYCAPFMKAIGYENDFACRLEKDERPAERLRIMEDLRQGKPVLGINLRVAPEWGVITGYADGGRVFYCRTYFDKPEERGDCPEAENWPFLIQHFGARLEKPGPEENLRASLRLLAESFEAPCNRGYYQGREAYERWIAGLRDEKLWKKSPRNKEEDIDRRLSVNDSMLLNLCDARRSAAAWLRENELAELAAGYQGIYDRLEEFRLRAAFLGGEPRLEEAALLEWALGAEREIYEKTKALLAAD
ncbi:MAG: helix-turn-helix domain-containing protein [Oscillospiraceae bacterium]|jgi:transcriptional regulator with XRE-family HTH domain|nr:helix-turn-helix domain-containing protein [Oscillospiraceae bacterium]